MEYPLFRNTREGSVGDKSAIWIIPPLVLRVSKGYILDDGGGGGG